jgi:hypothetical protein
VLRDPADEVQVVPLDAATAAFVAALQAGLALDAALACAPGLDLAGAFALLLRHGAIIGWTTGTSRP